jgi:hypothetical protein
MRSTQDPIMGLKKSMIEVRLSSVRAQAVKIRVVKDRTDDRVFTLSPAVGSCRRGPA